MILVARIVKIVTNQRNHNQKKKKKQLNFANFYQNFGSVVTRLHKNIIHSYFMRIFKT